MQIFLKINLLSSNLLNLHLMRQTDDVLHPSFTASRPIESGREDDVSELMANRRCLVHCVTASRRDGFKDSGHLLGDHGACASFELRD